MYVITFYSFKGGVGRSMALTNVAYELARDGQRVLVVDFDLEAPGLDTVQLPAAIRDTPGIVDFIGEYVRTGEAPEIGPFLYHLKDPSIEKGELWLMPAGKDDEAYASKLSSIDWAKLYSEQSGYMLLEDLKAQWKSAIAPDYVLIDSRTGHTDVGGICTRQLPDAVVVLFIPNAQNLRGLAKVVQDIRAEREGPRQKEIDVQFVMSNVPDLDDEEDILRKNLRAFERQLQFEKDQLLTIHRYDSLALLTQVVFTKTRRKSRLAREYRVLTSRLRVLNSADPQGALAFLQDPAQWLRLSPTRLDRSLADIESANPANGQVLLALGKVYRSQGRYSEAFRLLRDAQRAGYEKSDLLLLLAELYELTGDAENAASTALQILEMPAVDVISIQGAISIVRRGGVAFREHLARIGDGAAIADMPADVQEWLASLLSETRAEHRAAIRIVRRLQSRSTKPLAPESGLLNTLVLALIGIGDFEAAMREIEIAYAPGSERSIADQFNYAMASWGLNRHLDPNLLPESLTPPSGVTRTVDVNYAQCAAIALWARGRISEAMAQIRKARGLLEERPVASFSCWSYLRVSPAEFERDLSEIQQLLDGEDIEPRFFRAAENGELLVEAD
ncbi:MAG: hypothetical protein AMXMBFR55_23890 [Gemmatimonadota bacterium]